VVQEDGTGGFVVVVAAATVVSVEDVLAGLVRIGSFVVANDNLSCSSSAAFAAAAAASTYRRDNYYCFQCQDSSNCTEEE
jgi:hypothetical protein